MGLLEKTVLKDAVLKRPSHLETGSSDGGGECSKLRRKVQPRKGIRAELPRDGDLELGTRFNINT